jgi:hypothetical protein
VALLGLLALAELLEHQVQAGLLALQAPVGLLGLQAPAVLPEHLEQVGHLALLVLLEQTERILIDIY